LIRAREEARHLDHPWVGSEHLQLGLIGEEGSAGEILESMSISLEPAVARQRW